MKSENGCAQKKSIWNSLFWKGVERLSVQGINLIVQVVLARILLPEDFGNLAIVVAVTNYMAIFVQTGFATAIIQKKGIDDLDISTLCFTSLSIAATLYGVLFFLAPTIANAYQKYELVWPLRAIGILLFLNSISSIQTAIYSRSMQFKKIFIRSIVAVPVSGIVGIFLAIRGFGLWALVVHNILNTLVIVIIMAFDKECWIKIQFSFDRLRRLFPFSFKIIMAGLVSGGGDFFRTIIIGKKYSSEDLAYYDKAYTYSSYLTHIVGLTITSVMLPSLSREQNDIVRLKQLARKSISMSAFVMFPVLLGVAAVSDNLVYVLLTDKWSAAIPFLTVFCVLRMPSFISSIDRQVYYALGRSGVNLCYEMVLLVFNVASLVISIRFGVIYIAIGATLVEWLGCVAISIVSARIYKYSIKERFLDICKPLLNSVIMFIVVTFISRISRFGINIFLTLFIQISAGFVVYIVLVFLTRDRNIKEIYGILNNKHRSTKE